MNIMYCGDRNIKKGIYLSLMSLCKNTSQKLTIYILTASVNRYSAIEPQFAEELKNAISTYNECEINIFDLSDSFLSYSPTANLKTRFTPLCMLRLFADTVPKIPDKILYLDTDVLAIKDFCTLYNTDITDCEIAGTPDRYGKWFFGNIFKHNYLNSGVLLLNMENIRKSGLFLKCRKMCHNKKMFMPDQTALNKLSKKKKMPNFFNEQRKIDNLTVFRHFTTFFNFLPYFHAVTVKPWDIENMHSVLNVHEFDEILETYKRSNFYE